MDISINRSVSFLQRIAREEGGSLSLSDSILLPPKEGDIKKIHRAVSSTEQAIRSSLRQKINEIEVPPLLRSNSLKSLLQAPTEADFIESLSHFFRDRTFEDSERQYHVKIFRGLLAAKCLSELDPNFSPKKLSTEALAVIVAFKAFQKNFLKDCPCYKEFHKRVRKLQSHPQKEVRQSSYWLIHYLKLDDLISIVIN